jgi:ABC-2 type transport system ATP-binding protein
MSAIEIKQLTKVYRTHFGLKTKPTLESLDLNIRDNEVFGFLGKNGAGKTTTIKILCGLIKQTSGSAAIHGRSVRNRESRDLIGYLPENPYFYEYLNPKETIDFYGKLDGQSPKERMHQWDYLSELLDLRSIADQRVRGFSKGMRQRLGFAVALVSNPNVLILDEPMSGLDPMGRHRIRDIILHMRDEKKTVFFSSHILGDVEQICDRVGMLVDGKLRTQGTLNELLSRKVDKVELIARSLSDATHKAIQLLAIQVRTSGEGVHFYLENMDKANEAARKVYEGSGELLEMTPIKETLEDFFVREQNPQEVDA